ncbi:MAG TPA: hypothetical protein VJ385_01890 [Fibrobacteria bacterium]|nr:hypothetical protein [Fibrobacteria bacterium]
MTSLHRPHPLPFRAILVFLLFPLGFPLAGSWEVGYSFAAPTGQTNGLTFDGRYLWHTNDVEPIVYKINPFGGAVAGEMATTLQDQGDLEFGGKYLWVNSENDHYIHKVDPASGKTLDSILVLGIPPGFPRRNGTNEIQLEGITFDGRYLWVDGGTNRIIRIDPATKAQSMYEMSFDMGYLDGMAWAFDHLWVVTNNATIYELDPCSMEILDKFDAPASGGHGPEGFAFDGENLWFADNGIDMIYKIILKFRILTKRSAAGKVSAAAGCNQGELLTAPVSTAGAAPARKAAYRGAFLSTPLFIGPGNPARGADARLSDAMGRNIPLSPAPAAAPRPYPSERR